MKSTELKNVLKGIYRRLTSKFDRNFNLVALKAKIQANLSKIPSKTFLMDCHLHTRASDGKLSAQEYYQIGRAILGERFLFTTTDHEILTNFTQTHLWGVELNCKTASLHRMLGGFAHILSYFEDKPQNFTAQRYRYLKPIQVIQEIQSHEGIAVLAHIFAIGGTCQPEVLETCDALELNAILPGWINRKILQWAKEYKKPVIAGSDAHNLKHFFDGFTIFSQSTNLLDQIRKNKIQTCTNVSYDRLIPYYPLNLPSAMYKMIFRNDLL
ncbi:MAG: PHP-associated domain-containing protein [Promethearchaeota archaeon]